MMHLEEVGLLSARSMDEFPSCEEEDGTYTRMYHPPAPSEHRNTNRRRQK